MATKKKPSIKIKGWLLVFPDGKAVIPDIYAIQNFWHENGVRITIRQNIEEAIQAMYGLPLQRGRYQINQIGKQPLYRELEKMIQKMTAWQELKEKTLEAERKIKDASKLSEIDMYRMETSKTIKKNILKHAIKRRRRM